MKNPRLGRFPTSKKGQLLNLAKKLNRFTHGTKTEMITLLKDAGLEGPKFKRDCEKGFS